MRRVLFVLAAFAFGVTTSVQAQVCKSRNLKGSYAVLTEGHIAMSEGAPMTPFRSLAIQTFDSIGNQTTEGTLTTLMSDQPVTSTGSHVMNPDCSYQATYTMQIGEGDPQPDLRETCVVLDGGKQIRCRGMSPNAVYSSVLRRMKSVGRCQPWFLRGAFQADCSGWGATGVPENPYVPLEGLGISTLDKQANMTGWGNMSFGGNALVITYEADLEVDPDCTFTVDETDYNQAMGTEGSSSALGIFVDENTLHTMYLAAGQIFACTSHRIFSRQDQ